jgi:hypothetical protein
VIRPGDRTFEGNSAAVLILLVRPDVQFHARASGRGITPVNARFSSFPIENTYAIKSFAIDI